VQDQIERRVGGLTIRIDRLLCVGFGAATAAFEFDGDGIVAFRAEIDTVTRELLIHACETCPVDALTLIDEQGRQLVP
jgi:ferredoxin